MNEAVTPAELDSMLKNDVTVRVFDVRLEEDRVPVAHAVPGAQWRDPNRVKEWAGEIEPIWPIVVYCVHGLRVSQAVRRELLEREFDASILEGGIDAWQEYVLEASVANST